MTTDSGGRNRCAATSPETPTAAENPDYDYRQVMGQTCVRQTVVAELVAVAFNYARRPPRPSSRRRALSDLEDVTLQPNLLFQAALDAARTPTWWAPDAVALLGAVGVDLNAVYRHVTDDAGRPAASSTR